MEKLLPVRESASPYAYIEDNLHAVREEFYREAAQLQSNKVNVLSQLRRLLTAYEVLCAMRDEFRANGWVDGDDGDGTRVLVESARA